MVRVSRDLDIGRPSTESVVVEKMGTLISKVEDTTNKLEESIEELKKIRVGAGLIVGQDLEDTD